MFGQVFAVVAAVFVGGTFIRRWFSARLLDEGSGTIRFHEPVRAWVRRRPTSRFLYLKGGWGPVVLTVRDDVVSIRHRAAPRRLGAALGLEYTLATAGMTVDAADRAMSYGRQAVALNSHDDSGRPVELVVMPLDRDLPRLRAALAVALASAPSSGNIS